MAHTSRRSVALHPLPWILLALLVTAAVARAEEPVALVPHLAPGEGWRRAGALAAERPELAPPAAPEGSAAEPAQAAAPTAADVGRTVPFGISARREFYNELRQSVAALAGGGFATVWNDGEPPATAVRLQMVRADGSRVFAGGGLTLATAESNHFTTVLVAHAASGVFVAFERWAGSGSNQLVVQWIDGSGRARWPGEGVSAFGPPRPNLYYAEPSLVASPSGAVSVCAQRSVFDGNDTVWCQRIGTRGRTLWGATGKDAGGALGWRVLPKAVRADDDGLLVFWNNKGPLEPTSTPQLIEGQRFGKDGTALWGVDGRTIHSTRLAQGDSYIYNEHAAVTDGAGGAIVAWNDWDGTQPPSLDVVAQRVTAAGTPLWGAGVVVAHGPVAQQLDSLAPVAGGAVLVVDEFRTATFAPARIYRLSASGQPLWGANGQLLAGPATHALDYGSFAEGDGGVVRVAWIHQQAPATWNFDIYLARFSLAGARLTAAGGQPLSTVPLAKFLRGFAFSAADRTGLAVFEDRHPGSTNELDTVGSWFREAN